MLSDFPSPDVGSYLMKNHHEIQNSYNDAQRIAQNSQDNTTHSHSLSTYLARPEWPADIVMGVNVKSPNEITLKLLFLATFQNVWNLTIFSFIL